MFPWILDTQKLRSGVYYFCQQYSSYSLFCSIFPYRWNILSISYCTSEMIIRCFKAYFLTVETFWQSLFVPLRWLFYKLASEVINCGLIFFVLINIFILAAHLLASAGMDNSVCIWNVWSRGEKKACAINYHSAAVKDVRWSKQGPSLLVDMIVHQD